MVSQEERDYANMAHLSPEATFGSVELDMKTLGVKPKAFVAAAVKVKPLGTALMEFSPQLPQRERPSIGKSQGICSDGGVWGELMSVCKEPRLRKQFLSTLSQFQIASLRILLLWKSETVLLPESYMTNKKSPRMLPGENAFERLFQGEMRTEVPPSGVGEWLDPLRKHYETYKKHADLIDARNRAAELLIYCQLVETYLDSNFTIRGTHNQQIQPEYLRLERKIQEDSNSPPLSSTTGSCPWLVDEQRRDLPLYLWDAWEQRTVRTHQISEGNPKYLIVSHTWGRWRRKTRGLNMSPMVPWLVPENDLFPVQTLPTGLKQLAQNFGVRYIWFDLFCIPQDRSDEASREVSRQAIIFGGACYAVVWFTRTETWDYLRQIISWMILENLQSLNPRSSNMFGTHPCLKIALENLTRLLNGKTIPQIDLSGNPDIYYRSGWMDSGPFGVPWFSSLWTLQEISLRPDMLLVNKNWEPLTIGNKTLVAMDTILHLTSMIFDKRQPVPRFSVPPPVSWLKNLFATSGISYGFLKNPINFLTIGSVRRCSHSRSEAIMSILGCVDWHQERKATTVPAQPVSRSGPGFMNVFSLYEFEFVLEVRREYGFIFFCTKYADRNFFMDVVDSEEPHGTILPFCIDSSAEKVMDANVVLPLTQLAGHKSVDSWILLRDGSVKVNKVCILHRTSGTPPRPIRAVDSHIFDQGCLILGPRSTSLLNKKISKQPERYGHDSLGKWMEKWTKLTKSPLYAVVLFHGLHTIDGFILAEVPIPTRPKDKVLAKLADFQLSGLGRETKPTWFGVGGLPGLPEMEEVDWLIY